MEETPSIEYIDAKEETYDLITAVYLGCSFVTRRWDKTSIIWPVAGVSYGALRMICSLFMDRK